MYNFRFLSIWMFVCISCSMFANGIYVSPKGNDTQLGNSITHALRSLQRAADLAMPGDTVYVLPGLYSSPRTKVALTIQRSGLENKWIVFKNFSDVKPVIYITGEAAIELKSVAYISIEGFEITMDSLFEKNHNFLNESNDFISNGNGIFINRITEKNKMCHHINIKNNVIHHCPGSGILINHSDYLNISYNQINHNGEFSQFNNSAIKIQYLLPFDDNKGYHNILNANIIFNQRVMARLDPNTKNCEANAAASGISIRKNRNNTTVAGNLDYQNAWLISNNIIYKNGGVGIEIYETNNIDIVNNTTFKNNRNDAVKCGEIVVQSAKNVSVYNNIFYANHLKPGSRLDNPENVQFKNNLYWDFNTLSPGTVDIQADPLFQRANAFENIMDFSLRPKSPAINAGINEKLPAYDFYGNVRKLGPSVDLGAIEYAGPKLKPKNTAPVKVDEKTIKLFWQSSYSIKSAQYIVNNTRGRIFSCRMYDCRGKLIKEMIQQEESMLGLEFDVSPYPSGIYYFISFSEKEHLFSKIHVMN